MILAIAGVLAGPDLDAIQEAAARAAFGDGRVTAGARARAVKANEQALPGPGRDAILAKAQQAILTHPVFQAAARPRHLTPLILSRYGLGQTYGLHVDDPLMAGLRTDMSFTLFLSDPDSYDGGALEIVEAAGPRAMKLAAGDLLLYPATTLHQVTPVTRGHRVAIVGWVESWIRGAAEREILFDLDQVAASLSDVPRPVTDQLSKAKANLIRLWAGA